MEPPPHNVSMQIRICLLCLNEPDCQNDYVVIIGISRVNLSPLGWGFAIHTLGAARPGSSV